MEAEANSEMAYSRIAKTQHVNFLNQLQNCLKFF